MALNSSTLITPSLHIATTNHGQQRRTKAFSGWAVAEHVNQAVSKCLRKHPQPFPSPVHVQGLDVGAVTSVALPGSWELCFRPGEEVGTMM